MSLSSRTRSVARVAELEKQLQEAIKNRNVERQSSHEDKINLENKCAELKEQFDYSTAELSQVNEKSKRQELELLQFKQGKST